MVLLTVRDNFECSNCGWIGRRDGGSVIER
jgi:hypothetical protein